MVHNRSGYANSNKLVLVFHLVRACVPQLYRLTTAKRQPVAIGMKFCSGDRVVPPRQDLIYDLLSLPIP